MVKNEKKNSGNLLAIALIILAVVILIAVIVGSSITGNAIKSSESNTNSYSEPICSEIQVPYDYLEEYSETVPYTDRECEEKVLIYNRGEFNLVSSVCNNEVEECVDYTLGFCTKKISYCTDRTITCSLGINNIDDERGVWSADFKFYKTETKETDAESSSSVYIEPHSSGTLMAQGKITSKELLDTRYSCSYSLSQEPTKQVCRDVTKYKELIKTRTVTRYKTEEQCK